MKVFCYGTLKKGGRFHHLLKSRKAKFVDFAQIKGTMYNLGEFPAIVLMGHNDIHGELYEIDADTLQELDHLEGYPNFYDRQVVATSRGDAWVYFHQYDERLLDTPIMRDGVWPVAVEEEDYV